jgi:hypothetical protein
MGCLQFRHASPLRIIIENVDLGNAPSSNESTPMSSSLSASPTSDIVVSPVTNRTLFKESNFVKFRRNALNCYFCHNNFGLLIKMKTCTCKFFGHYSCLQQWIDTDHYTCSICKQNYYNCSQLVKRQDKNLRKALSLSTLRESEALSLANAKCLFLIDTVGQNDYRADCDGDDAKVDK